MKNIDRTLLLFLCTALLGMSAVMAAAPSSKAGKGKNPDVIRVGTVTIKQKDVDTLLSLFIAKKYGDAQVPEQQVEVLRKLIANNMVNQELLNLESSKRGIEVKKTEIDSAQELFKSQFPTPAEYQKALKNAGDTEKSLREKLERLVRVEKLLKDKMPGMQSPGEEEMRTFFEQHKGKWPKNDSLRASQIVLEAKKGQSPEQKAQIKSKLEKMRHQLEQEKDATARMVLFTRMAAENSQTPEGRQGGDLQRFHPGDFFPEFKRQVAKLEVGEMTPVFETRLGYHLVLLTEKYDGKFESYRFQITQLLAMHRMAQQQEKIAEYLDTLTDKYKVSYLDKRYQPPAKTP